MPFQYPRPLYTALRPLYIARPTNHQPSPDHPFVILESLIHPLVLRTPKPTDAPSLLRHFSDERNTRYDRSVRVLNNPTAIALLIQRWSTISAPLSGLNVVVEVEGELVGVGGLGWIGLDKPFQNEGQGNGDGKELVLVGNAGIMLDTKVRGKGYAVAALGMVIDYGFRVLGLDECRIAATDDNLPMKGLMEKRFGLTGVRIGMDHFENEWVWIVRRKDWVGGAEIEENDDEEEEEG